MVAQIAQLNNQQPQYYDYEGGLKNVTEKVVEDTKQNLNNPQKRYFLNLNRVLHLTYQRQYQK